MVLSELCADLTCERSYSVFESFRILAMTVSQDLALGRQSVHLLVRWDRGTTEDYWCLLCDECYYTVMLQLLEAE